MQRLRWAFGTCESDWEQIVAPNAQDKALGAKDETAKEAARKERKHAFVAQAGDHGRRKGLGDAVGAHDMASRIDKLGRRRGEKLGPDRKRKARLT